MKYTIPYEDKITLPHIKKIESIGINADNLYYDKKELSGEVVISGDYTLSNSEDVFEFTHDIPVSFLIDDASITPQVNIANFKYELIAGRGLEIMFDLDIILSEEAEIKRDEITDEDAEEIKQFQTQIDTNLDLVLNNKKQTEAEMIEDVIEATRIPDGEDEEEERDDDILEEFNDDNDKEEIIEEIIEDAIEATRIPDEEEERNDDILEEFNDDNDKEEIIEEIIEDIKEEVEEIPVIIDKELDDFILSTKLQPTITTFDTGFVPKDKDKYTTYKILMIDDGESIESLLESRNLSKSLICKQYEFDKKIVLKIEND